MRVVVVWCGTGVVGIEGGLGRVRDGCGGMSTPAISMAL